MSLGLDERLLLAAAVAALGALVGAVGAAWAGPGRWRWTAALLPAAALWALALAPRVGRLHVRVHDEWIYGIALGLGIAVLALRTAARPAVALLAGAVFAAGLAKAPWSLPHPRGSGRPLLLLTLDTARADRFGFAGGPPGITESLDRLAARCRVFERAYAPLPLTGPSHASMLSGVPPTVHGIHRNGVALDERLPWVPELLRAAGFVTEASVSAGVLDASLGFDRGFDRYDSTFERRLARGHPLASFLGWRPRAGSAVRRAGADTLALARPPGRGTFGWVHLYDAHDPYTARPETAARLGITDASPFVARGGPLSPDLALDAAEEARGVAMYTAGIADLDALVGTLLPRLDPDTALIVVGDHGEGLTEHGVRFEHGRRVWTHDVAVPLAICAPEIAPARIETPVSLLDIAPTLLDLAGLPRPEGTSGRSLLEPPDPERIVVSVAYENEVLSSVAARRGHRSVVFTEGEAAAFDLSADPLETAPLPISEDDPLMRAVDAVRRAAVPGEGIDPEQAEMLRALGYAD